MTEPIIDPVRYGVLWQKVEGLEQKVDRLEQNTERLLELANKSKGGFWFGMAVVSGVSSLMGYISHFFKGN